jgi:hypothetical protein
MSVTAFANQCRFDKLMDHQNAIRLLRALVARGCKSDEPMADAFIQGIALEIGLAHEFDAVFAYAVGPQHFFILPSTPLEENSMNRPTMFVMTVLAATFFCSPGSKALAQQPSSSSVTLLCKTSPGGSGFVFVTLTNLTTTTIPKGQALFATRGNETIKFEAAEAIPENGSVAYRTSVAAFQVDGDCTGLVQLIAEILSTEISARGGRALMRRIGLRPNL